MKIFGHRVRWPGLRPILVRLIELGDQWVESRQPKRPAREHDFREHLWGWHFSTWEFDRSRDPSIAPGPKFYGHGYGLAVGDTVILKMESGRDGRWRINELKYCSDPPDMFWARATLKEYVDG